MKTQELLTSSFVKVSNSLKNEIREAESNLWQLKNKHELLESKSQEFEENLQTLTAELTKLGLTIESISVTISHDNNVIFSLSVLGIKNKFTFIKDDGFTKDGGFKKHNAASIKAKKLQDNIGCGVYKTHVHPYFLISNDNTKSFIIKLQTK